MRDLSLPNLIQVQCGEQNQSRVVLTRGKHQGTLVFAQGELIYAQLGELTGEEAVYKLLTWEEGEFRVDDQVTAPERNVKLSWSALLIEGLRRADEARAERDTFLQARLHAFKDKPGVRGALVVSPNGSVRAEFQGDDVPGGVRALLQAYANVEQIQKLLNTGAPLQILWTGPNEKIWVQKIQADYFVCWLDNRVALETIAAAVQAMLG